MPAAIVQGATDDASPAQGNTPKVHSSSKEVHSCCQSCRPGGGRLMQHNKAGSIGVSRQPDKVRLVGHQDAELLIPLRVLVRLDAGACSPAVACMRCIEQCSLGVGPL